MRNMMIPTQLPVVAVAGGVVISQEFHPAYGNMIKIAYGNDLMTRYAHASKTHAKRGDLIKCGQKIADVGSAGRSTGPHLHVEVWVQGVAQDTQKFLVARKNLPPQQVVRANVASSGRNSIQVMSSERRLPGQR